MKTKVTLVLRILLGLVFFAAGLAGLFNLAPPPADLPEKLITFNNGLMATGYFMPFLKSVEVFCGLLLITGMFVPLALVILAPIVINIFFVHAFLAPEGVPLAIILGVILTYLAFFAEPYSAPIKALFRRRGPQAQ